MSDPLVFDPCSDAMHENPYPSSAQLREEARADRDYALAVRERSGLKPWWNPLRVWMAGR